MNANELKVGHRILYRESWSRQVKEGIVEKITPKGYVKISGRWLTEDQMNWLELTEDLGFVEKEESMTLRAKVLRAIGRFPGVHGGDLARMYETDRGNMSRLIKSLEKEGLIEVRAERHPSSRIVYKKLYRVE